MPADISNDEADDFKSTAHEEAGSVHGSEERADEAESGDDLPDRKPATANQRGKKRSVRIIDDDDLEEEDEHHKSHRKRNSDELDVGGDDEFASANCYDDDDDDEFERPPPASHTQPETRAKTPRELVLGQLRQLGCAVRSLTLNGKTDYTISEFLSKCSTRKIYHASSQEVGMFRVMVIEETKRPSAKGSPPVFERDGVFYVPLFNFTKGLCKESDFCKDITRAFVTGVMGNISKLSIQTATKEARRQFDAYKRMSFASDDALAGWWAKNATGPKKKPNAVPATTGRAAAARVDGRDDRKRSTPSEMAIGRTVIMGILNFAIPFLEGVKARLDDEE